MKRNDYRTRLKAMSDKALLSYIDRKTTHLLACGDYDDHKRLIYAEELAKKRGLINNP